MSTSKVLGIIVLVAVLGFGGYWVYRNANVQNRGATTLGNGGNNVSKPQSGDSPSSPENPGAPAATPAGGNPVARSVTVSITDSGFVPAMVNIKKGDSVTWVNNSSSPVWPASANHPTHTVYPGSGIEKCDTADQPGIFDACLGIALGGSWTFRFNEIGSWKYHDHLDPSHFGTVNVD